MTEGERSREELEAALEAARGVLTEAAQTFRAYEKLHLAKGTPDGNAKAATNADMAHRCEDALSTLYDRVKGEGGSSSTESAASVASDLTATAPTCQSEGGDRG